MDNNYHKTDINIDGCLPCIYPFTGILSKEKYKRLCNILCGCFGRPLGIASTKKSPKQRMRENLDFIIDNLKKSKPDVITTKKGTMVDKTRRSCLRHTFSGIIVKKIKELILSDIKERAEGLPIMPEDIIIDPSHGDILYYKKGDFFDNHRDSVSKKPEEIKDSKNNWRMYSILIGVDSNLQESEGMTTVYLPSIHYLNNSTLFKSRLMPKHLFKESCIPANYLIFPSEAVHSSTKIMTPNSHKLTVKLDLWIKIQQSSKIAYNYMSFCSCTLCCSSNCTITSFINTTEVYLPINTNLLRIIGEYYVTRNTERNPCCEQEFCWCDCTCKSCVDSYACMYGCVKRKTIKKRTESDDEDEYYRQLHDDDGMCNGYELDDGY
jgi:hypothetical protein